jgi:branched-chain amino acid transport system permease protein
MSTTDKQQAPGRHAAGEELPPAFVPVTTQESFLRRFWEAANLSSTPGRPGSTLLRHLVAALIGFFIVTAIAVQLSTYNNYLFAEIAGSLCAAAGLTVLIGQNGQLSLGHGAIMAVGAYGVALTQLAFADKGWDSETWSIFVSLGVGVVAAVIVGLVVGLAAARLRGPYLAGITLALALVVQPVTTYLPDIFNGDQGKSFTVPDYPASFGPAFRQDEWSVWIAGGGALLVLLFLANLGRSRIGRNFKAVRDDEIAAQLSGIRVARTQITAFVISAAAAGLGGGLFAMLQFNAQPGAFGLQVSLYLFLAIIIGGLGSLTGAVWGAIAITLLPELTKNIGQDFNSSADMLNRLNGNLSLAIFGVALIIIMIVAPGGVQGLLYRVRRWSGELFKNARR